MQTIDLRSDTVTRPGPEMRRAMAEAEVGDDVYGEDPTVLRLEARIAERLGHEAALFVPSGTMANQLALGVQLRPGDEVIADVGSHCINFEGGALSALWGAQPKTIEGKRGLFEVAQLATAIRPVADHFPRSRVVCLENTHNRGGGTVWPLQMFEQVVAEARRRELKVHLDGARLFNAEIASGVPARSFASLTDSVAVCFSKGLGAPAGSALCGSRELVREARRLRKRLGGGMRQVGVLAAAALWALEHNVQRLEADHRSARRLAEGLAELPGVELDLERVQTNMVFARFPLTAAEMVSRLREVGVLANPEGSDASTVRMVTHLDVTMGQIEEAVERIHESLRM